MLKNVGAEGASQFSVTSSVEACPGAVVAPTADNGAPSSAQSNTGAAGTRSLVWFGVGALAFGVVAVVAKRRATTTVTQQISAKCAPVIPRFAPGGSALHR